MGISPRAASLKATDKRNPDLVRNLMEGTESSFPSVFGLCEALDIPLASIIVGAEVAHSPSKEWLTVVGEVEAGIFKEQFEWNPDDWYQAEVDYLDDRRKQHGLVVRGRSMEKRLPPGTILRCVELIVSQSMDYTSGDYVIVERKRAGLVELTCKRLELRPDGAWELIAESYLPEFQEPIYIGRPINSEDGPSFDALDDNDIRVRAVVIDAYLPLRRRRTRPIAVRG